MEAIEHHVFKLSFIIEGKNWKGITDNSQQKLYNAQKGIFLKVERFKYS
jgi:hypothetical protein